MSHDPFSPPQDLVERLQRDYLLSVMRLIAGRTADPLSFVMELDALLEVPEGERTERFGALLSDFEQRLSAPPKQGGDDSSVYL